MTDATEEAPRRKSVPRPQQRVAFMVSNGINFQDVLAASCRTVTMSRAIAEAQGLVEATQPPAAAPPLHGLAILPREQQRLLRREHHES